MRPRLRRTAGHDAGAASGAFLAAGDAGADVEQPFAFEILHAAVGVFEERIAAIDDDVAGLEVGNDLFDEFVDRGARFDHEHDAPGFLEQPNHLLDGVSADHLAAFGFFLEEVVDFGDGPVERDDGVAVVVHVEDEVLAHHRQTN